jgi:hypothetical protein
MIRIPFLLCAVLVSSSVGLAQQKPALPVSAKPAAPGKAVKEGATGESEASKLPVRRVVLYKNGVGCFEHLGRVRNRQDVHVDFTSAQLNDVLMSLTVLDLSERTNHRGRLPLRGATGPPLGDLAAGTR